MSDDLLSTQDEIVVKDFVTSLLAFGPAQRTTELLARARIRRRRQRMLLASLAAVLVLCLYALSPFVVPTLARVISAVPGVGPGFEQALKLYSLDLAYEAGLISAIDKSVERDGVTLTVHTAYRDFQTFELLYSISGDAELIKTMNESIGPTSKLSSGKWKVKGTYSRKLYDAENNMLYVTVGSFDPFPWYVRKLDVSVCWMTNQEEMEKYKRGVDLEQVQKSEPLMVTIPVQRVSARQTKTVPINQTIISEGTTVRLKSLVFSPVRTILKYTYTGKEPVLKLLDEDGEWIKHYSMSDNPKDAFESCQATRSKEVTIRFLGYRVETDVEVPLQVGYEHRGEPGFKIESITPTKELLPWFGTDGDYYADTKVVLSWEQGKWKPSSFVDGCMDWAGDKVTLLLRREGRIKNKTLSFTIVCVEGEPQEITVKR